MVEKVIERLHARDAIPVQLARIKRGKWEWPISTLGRFSGKAREQELRDLIEDGLPIRFGWLIFPWQPGCESLVLALESAIFGAPTRKRLPISQRWTSNFASSRRKTSGRFNSAVLLLNK